LVTWEPPLCRESGAEVEAGARRAGADEQTPLKIGGMEKLKSCAIVGNSGHILDGNYGKAIDNHEMVVRVNHLRTQPAARCAWLRHVRRARWRYVCRFRRGTRTRSCSTAVQGMLRERLDAALPCNMHLTAMPFRSLLSWLLATVGGGGGNDGDDTSDRAWVRRGAHRGGNANGFGCVG